MTPPPADPMETGHFQPPRERAAPAVTVDLAPSSQGSESIEVSRTPRVAFVEEEGASPSDATSRLRQGRLRAAALFLCLWWGLILVQNLRADSPWEMIATVTLAEGAAFVFLSPSRPIPSPWLRVLECAIFGLAAMGFGVFQYGFLLDAVASDDRVAFVATIKNTLINSITLMFAYTVLIPNSWRSALGVVLGLTVYPAVAAVLLFLVHPEVLRYTIRVGAFGHLGLNLTMALVAASLSLYGAHVVDTLRHEVFEARRLNQYQLGACLGSGGMGTVYLAEHRLLKRPCAVKLIRPEAAGDAKSLKRFEREVRATARLSHPNIVEIYDYGHTEDRTFYYVMEHLRGFSFGELVEHHGPLPAGRVIYLIRQACEGLAEAHSAGLIHRDLKPANLFTARLGRRFDVVKLLDFGLVQGVTDELVDLSGEDTISGTPLYMAPEQARGDRKLDHRCDLYALGAVAYFLLTGRPPFEGRNAFQVLLSLARDPLMPPSHHVPSVPEDLERVVLRCLAKNPTDRYPDAETLSLALTSCTSASEWDSRQAARWWTDRSQDNRRG